LQKLNKHDIDQEVKQLSIIASADLVSCCNAQLTADQINKVIQVFVSRLTHELTRDTALKGLTLIALNDTTDNRSRQQPLQRHEVVNLQGMNQHLPALLDLLNKSQRQLQLNTLECLEALTRRYSA
jgi:paraquat-inducible protein B